jgi:hypothetical protein
VAPVEEIEDDFYEQYKKEFGMELAHRRQIQAGGVGIYNSQTLNHIRYENSD